jgi:hypothetical protein
MGLASCTAHGVRPGRVPYGHVAGVSITGEPNPDLIDPA